MLTDLRQCRSNSKSVNVSHKRMNAYIRSCSGPYAGRETGGGGGGFGKAIRWN